VIGGRAQQGTCLVWVVLFVDHFYFAIGTHSNSCFSMLFFFFFPDLLLVFIN
jgi:hypothetical protein